MNLPIPRFVGATLSLLVAGCSLPLESKPDPSRFYVLDAPASPKTDKASWPFAVAVARVRLPEYLDRPQVVTRNAENRVTFSEFHRWSGTLDKAASRVLADILAARLGTSRIAGEPALDAYRDGVIVQVEALRFDGVLGGEITLRVRWHATAVHSGETLIADESTVKVTATGDSYDAYAVAMASALDRLGGEIATAMRARITASPAGLPVVTR